MCYKMLHRLVDVYVSHFLVLSDVLYYRGNCKKLVQPRSLSVRDANLFSKRIVNIWNSLPDSFVSAIRVSRFKRRLTCVCLSVLSQICCNVWLTILFDSFNVLTFVMLPLNESIFISWVSVNAAIIVALASCQSHLSYEISY